MKKKILLVTLITLVIMQFFKIDKSAPDYNKKHDFLVMAQADDEIAHILKVACYDCHSYETEYPWYTNIAPLSFWIKGHINGARQNINYSEWNNYDQEKRNHKLKETIEEIEEGHMPPKSYAWLHPDAQLTKEDENKLITWLKSQIN